MTISPLLPPGSTIGILGGGQLGRMMAMAAAEMGYHVHIYCPEKDCPASEVAGLTTTAPYEDTAALKCFADSVDVITYEFENIPAPPLKSIAGKIKPGLDVLVISQHRLLEKQALNKMGIVTAPFAAVRNRNDLNAAAKKIGLPAILKTATMGYDGKGQWKLELGWQTDDDAPWLSVIGSPACDLILEGYVPFIMEISVIVARDMKGNIECYPAVQNIHKHHILSETIAPAPISKELAKRTETIARTIAKGLNLVGLIAVEMFVTSDEKIIVNELAPRPHNSGHWTMDACITSQFTQAIRAVCGLPLGSPTRLCDAKMLNLIGDDINDWQKYAASPNAKLHIYGKKESRPGRKMGHVTFLS